ncbi:hypothetical protein [Clostridium botulinum]|uniref:hypothetical protein n=1 Tax=Clostridium botulinum TaxID=1491 RepID=UPI00137872BE|nr:hypothetical protein [Clostridium botulinum]
MNSNKIREKYNVALWKEYIPHFKQIAWVCLIGCDFDKAFTRKTLKEIEYVLNEK